MHTPHQPCTHHWTTRPPCTLHHPCHAHTTGSQVDHAHHWIATHAHTTGPHVHRAHYWITTHAHATGSHVHRAHTTTHAMHTSLDHKSTMHTPLDPKSTMHTPLDHTSTDHTHHWPHGSNILTPHLQRPRRGVWDDTATQWQCDADERFNKTKQNRFCTSTAVCTIYYCCHMYRNSPTIRPPFLSSSSRFKRGVGVYLGTCANTPVIRPPYVAV